MAKHKKLHSTAQIQPANPAAALSMVAVVASPSDAQSGIYCTETLDFDKHLGNLAPEADLALRKQLDDLQFDMGHEMALLKIAATKLLEVATIIAPNQAEAEEAANVLVVVAELSAVDEPAQRRQIMKGYRLGRLIERITVRPFETLVVKGKGSVKRASGARVKRNAISIERKAWVRAKYKEELKADPKDKAKARRAARDAFMVEFPGIPLALSTVETWVAKRRH